MAPSTGKKEDPIEKIGRLIDERISAAFEGRERKEVEAKDPWARLEGIIDRKIGEHFKAFSDGIADGGDEGDGKAGKAGKGNKDADDGGPLSLFGG